MIPALAVNTAGGAKTPLAYGDDLDLFLTAGSGITGSGSSFDWEGQEATGLNFTVPGGDDGPVFDATYQNGLPAVDFSATLDTRLRASATTVLQDYIKGGGTRGLAFAAKVDFLPAPGVNGTDQATLMEKAFFGTGTGQQGWSIILQDNGDFDFAYQNTSDGSMRIRASTFYSAGDLVLGYISTTGGFLSSSITMTLWNGADFVDTGSITIPGSGTTLGSDSSKSLTIGNNSRQGSGGFNAPWTGGIMDLWLTKPANSSIDQSYLRRYIP
jgi:hypothetical protein